MSVTLPTIHCWESNHWERAVYVKKAPAEDKNAIVLTEKKVIRAKEWTNETAYAEGAPWIPASMGTLEIPPGRYVAHANNSKKLYVVSEINGKDPSRSSGFWSEERGVIVFKAAGATLIGLVPIYTAINLVLNSARIPMNLFDRCRKAFQEIQEAIKKHAFCDVPYLLTKLVLADLTQVLAEGIWSVVRVPFYAVALQVALLYTIISPYNGRHIVAEVERAWHAPCTLDDDIRRDKVKADSFNEVLHTLNYKVLYLFFCFQPSISYEQDARYVKLEASST